MSALRFVPLSVTLSIAIVEPSLIRDSRTGFTGRQPKILSQRPISTSCIANMRWGVHVGWVRMGLVPNDR